MGRGGGRAGRGEVARQGTRWIRQPQAHHSCLSSLPLQVAACLSSEAQARHPSFLPPAPTILSSLPLQVAAFLSSEAQAGAAPLQAYAASLAERARQRAALRRTQDIDVGAGPPSRKGAQVWGASNGKGPLGLG